MRLLSWIIAPALLASPASPLSAAASDSVELITVTAHLTPQSVADTGSSLTVLTREEIERQQFAVAADALRTVPGVTVGRTGPIGAQTQIRVRGAEANHVLVVIDGVEVNDLAADDAFAFEHLTAFDIERIEVVRGPQSALWGSDALAGVVNVVTRRPTTPLEAGGFAEGGAFDFLNAGARFGMASDRGTVAASLTRMQTDGENTAELGSEDDGYENDTLSLLGTLQLSDDLELDAHWRHSDSRNEYDASDLVEGVYVAVDADNVKNVRQDFGRAGATLVLADGRWRQSLHYGVAVTETDSRAAETFPDGNPNDGGFDAAAIKGNRYGLYYQTSLTLGAAAGPGEAAPDVVTVAVDHEREQFNQRAEVSFGDPNQEQSVQVTGVVLEYLAPLSENLSVSASLRHDNNSDFGDVNTWRSTASWRFPDTATRLHGSFGTGQKSPTMYERFGYTPDQFIGNPDLDPETSHGWDAGIEQGFLDGRVVTDLTYFSADLRREIDGFVFDPDTFLFTAANTPGRSERRGVEFAARTTLAERYTINANYTYSDSRSGSDQREVRRPLHSATLDLGGSWFDDRLGAHLGITHTGKRQDDAFLAGPPFVDRVELDSYTLVKLAMSYAVTPDVTLYGRVENLLDEDYQDVYGFNTPGVGGFVGLRLRFAGE